MLWVFDVNETMLDLSPLDEVFAKHTGVPHLRTRWFDLLIRAALATTAAGSYRDFAQLGIACARVVAQAHGKPLDESAIAELGAAMRTLPAHPDTHTALTALRERGERLVALANSPQATVDAQLQHAGIAPLFNAIYSAERAGMLKPAPAAYRMVLQAEAVSAEHAVMVAAHDWDIAGAQAVGMQTVFVARGDRVPLPGWPPPTRTAPDLVRATITNPA
ncbi:MAG TPA: haloacid dehalogenase type II [Actinoplanes sp.]|jgi:2-haloacid dehalogenase|nr:haloacid dehalogenase type II [Actinoplanes sp.]